jgi:hypothetical protein
MVDLLIKNFQLILNFQLELKLFEKSYFKVWEKFLKAIQMFSFDQKYLKDSYLSKTDLKQK